MALRYRLGWKVWLPAVVGWLAVATLFTGLGVKHDDVPLFFIAAIFLLLSAWAGISGYNSWVEVCPTGIGGHWNNRKYFIPWRSIHAMWVENENNPNAMLRLGTDLGTIILSLRGLPIHAILWNVRFRLPPIAQTAQAQQLYTARRQYARRVDPVQIKLPLEIRHSRRLRLLLWSSTLLWTILIFLNLTYYTYLLGLLVSIVMILLNLVGEVLLAERLLLDSEGITQTLLFGTHRISWDEIERVRMGSTGQTMIVEGQGKRLIISGLRHWYGADAKTAQKFFLHQIDLRNITPALDHWVEFKIFVSRLGSRQA